MNACPHKLPGPAKSPNGRLLSKQEFQSKRQSGTALSIHAFLRQVSICRRMTQRVTMNPSAAVYTAFKIANPAKESPWSPSTRNVPDMSGAITAAATTPISKPKDQALLGKCASTPLSEKTVSLVVSRPARNSRCAAGVTNKDTSSDSTMDVTAVSAVMPLPPESGTNAIRRLPSHAIVGLSTALMTAQAMPCAWI
jgi:hypothetical protein